MITTYQDRIQDPEFIDANYIDQELRLGKHVIVQFSDKCYSNEKLFQLNKLCQKYDESFGVRFYGHYADSFDFKTLLLIPEVKCLYVDCLTKAENVQVISELRNLRMLSFGVFELKDTEILDFENLKQLTTLILTETRTKAVNLDYLRDYTYLQSLIIGQHHKNINAVGELSNLEFLSLNSIKQTPVTFINKLKKLKTLRLLLGGRDNILEIEENGIENLDIDWVRGFNDISNISKFRQLKTLSIENTIQLPRINFDTTFDHLTDLKILTCKSLSSLNGLNNLPSLHQLRIYNTQIDFDELFQQEMPSSLKIFGFYTTKKKANDIIRQRLDGMGYREFYPIPSMGL